MGNETQSGIARLIELATIEKRLVKTNSARFIIALDDSVITAADVLDPKCKDKIRCTSGDYFLKYDPVGSKFKNPKYPYTIKTSDMLGWNLKVSGPNHLHAMKKIFPEVAWILRNSYYDDSLFAIARTNPGMIVSFSLDFIRYQHMLMTKMNAMGLDPSVHHPFVTFRFAESLPHTTIDEESFWPELNEAKSKYWSETKRFDAERGAELAKTNQ